VQRVEKGESREINVKRGIPNRIKKGFAGKGKPADGE
jgi:hypothetical protein